MIGLTKEQKNSARAAIAINRATQLREALRLFIYEGIEVDGQGQRFDNGMTGWDGFTNEQKGWLVPFVGEEGSKLVK